MSKTTAVSFFINLDPNDDLTQARKEAVLKGRDDVFATMQHLKGKL
jgi:hypothetical protein